MRTALRAVAVEARAPAPAAAVELIVRPIVAGIRMHAAQQQIARRAALGGADLVGNGLCERLLHAGDDARLALRIAGDARRGEDRIGDRAGRRHHLDGAETAAVERHVARAHALQNRRASSGGGRNPGDVDRPFRLRVRAREIDHHLVVPDVHGGTEEVFFVDDTVVLEIILARIHPVRQAADLGPHPLLGMLDQGVADTLERFDAEFFDQRTKASLGGIERADHGVKIAPGRVGCAVIGKRDAPHVLHIFAPRHQLDGRQPQAFLKHLGRGTGERAHRHAADLGDMGDVGRVTDQPVAHEHGLHQQMFGHVALAPVGIVVHDNIALLDILFTQFLDAKRHGMKARADDRRVHFGLTDHAEPPVEKRAGEIPRFTEDR